MFHVCIVHCSAIEGGPDLAEKDRFRRVSRVHHVFLHPAGPGKAPLRETATRLD